ncbi:MULTISPECIES: AfsR/SARP family transcriptional regulator [unclassified Streptomyces]|uniref:AfsR/SARP family transcriptional regulator n=1 Tax=unclassified Streptomyces TaxID=2593676 RepID=UPI0033E71A3E
MEFRLLGPLELRGGGGEVIPLRAARQRSLLAGLLLSANQVVSVRRLVNVVWGQSSPTSAVANLRTHVTGLRRLLSAAEGGADSPGGAVRLGTRPGGYQLTVLPGELDLTVFEELVAQGRHALRQRCPADAAPYFGRALRLWRGQPLENVLLYGSGEADLARLEEVRPAVVEDWLRARLACGEHAEVIGELRALVVEQPLRERLWALLMLALHRTGRRADALGAYDQARARLVDELGLDPGRELSALHQRILNGDPALTAGPAGAVGWEPLPGSTPVTAGATPVVAGPPPAMTAPVAAAKAGPSSLESPEAEAVPGRERPTAPL